MEDIRIKGNLTPNFVSDKLAPFLDAIQNIQHTIDEIKQVPPTPVKVNEIRWEGVDTLENNVLPDMPTVTVFLSEAQKALVGLRETLDYLNEEPRNLELRWASAGMAKSLYETTCLIVHSDFEPFLDYRDYLEGRIKRQSEKTLRVFRPNFSTFDIGVWGFNEQQSDNPISDETVKRRIIEKREEK